MTSPPTDPRRLLLGGDAHGDREFLRRCVDHARAEGCEALVQLGDLGAFWPGTVGYLSSGSYLDDIGGYAAERDVRFVFLDGNHEGWDLLSKTRDDAPVSPEGFRQVAPGVEWADRGTRWRWNGVRFGALGGAFSVDYRRRKDGATWWSELELPRADEADRLMSGGPLDVLLTHDAPLAVTDALKLGSTYPMSAADEARADGPRNLISDVVDATAPGLVVHGHWHERHTTVIEAGVRVEGLAANFSPWPGTHLVLDIGDGVPRIDGDTP